VNDLKIHFLSHLGIVPPEGAVAERTEADEFLYFQFIERLDVFLCESHKLILIPNPEGRVPAANFFALLAFG